MAIGRTPATNQIQNEREVILFRFIPKIMPKMAKEPYMAMSRSQMATLYPRKGSPMKTFAAKKSITELPVMESQVIGNDKPARMRG